MSSSRTSSLAILELEEAGQHRVCETGAFVQTARECIESKIVSIVNCPTLAIHSVPFSRAFFSSREGPAANAGEH